MSSSRSQSWWPAVEAGTLLAVPPFPESRPNLPVSTASRPARVLARSEIRECIAAMRRHRVGGTFWAAQPEIPGQHMIIVRPRDLTQSHAMATAAASAGSQFLFWFPHREAERCASVTGPSIVGPCDPWHLLSHADEVWAAPDDEFALLAAIAGVPQRLFDEEERPAGIQPGQVDAEERLNGLFDRVAVRDPFSGDEITPSALIEILAVWRPLIDANRPITSVYGIAAWKRRAIAPLLWGGRSVDFSNTAPKETEERADASAAWIARTPVELLGRLRETRTSLYQVEDGFIRSVGLGAECVPPLSIVVDPHGAHYDPRQASGLEMMLAQCDFDEALLERARQLRALIVAQGISKYGVGTAPAPRAQNNVRNVLVTGQVEDDQSVLKGGAGITSNLDLLRRVRALEPDAFILYRPHPDVDAGHRRGYIADDVTLGIANAVAREGSITALIEAADHIHVLTSLAGFEALLRKKPVTTHGVPFYAGWGLTHDLGPVPSRRRRRLSLDELVAATLLLYPRYLDPVTGLPCTPEILIQRLGQGHREQNKALVFLRRQLGLLTRLRRRISIW